MARKNLKEDKLNEFVGAAAVFIREKEKLILEILVVLVAAVLIFIFLNSHLQKKKLISFQLLSRGQTLFTEGKFTDALKLFRDIRANYPGSKAGEKALIYTADIYYHLGKLNEAEAGYNEYLSTCREGEFSGRAQEGLGYILEERGNFQKAIEAYMKVCENYHGSYLIPDALLGAARCYEALGMWNKAKETYEKLISSCPWSSSVPAAKAYLDVAEQGDHRKQGDHRGAPLRKN